MRQKLRTYRPWAASDNIPGDQAFEVLDRQHAATSWRAADVYLYFALGSNIQNCKVDGENAGVQSKKEGPRLGEPPRRGGGEGFSIAELRDSPSAIQRNLSNKFGISSGR
jgi:hypothetical protein